MKMKKLGFFLLMLSFPFWSIGQNTPKEKKVVELVKVMGGGEIAKQVMGSLITSFKTVYTEVPEEFWDDFVKEVDSREIENMLVPIYLKYYSEKELDDMIAFYKSPTGKKMIESMPGVMQESMEVGKAWGAKLAERVMYKLNKKKK